MLHAFARHEDGIVSESTAADLINRFRSADLALKKALENGNDTEITSVEANVEQILSNMIECSFTSAADRKLIMHFLFENFVLDGDSRNSLRGRICERAVALI
jgi:hypothetical protein